MCNSWHVCTAVLVPGGADGWQPEVPPDDTPGSLHRAWHSGKCRRATLALVVLNSVGAAVFSAALCIKSHCTPANCCAHFITRIHAAAFSFPTCRRSSWQRQGLMPVILLQRCLRFLGRKRRLSDRMMPLLSQLSQCIIKFSTCVTLCVGQTITGIM